MHRDTTTRATSVPIYVVDGYGVSLNVEGAHLVIRDGFGLKDKRREARFARGRNRLSRILVRAPAGAVSLSAIDWCNRMGVPIAVVGSDSNLLNCFIPDTPHDGPLKRAQALAALTDDGLRIARVLLTRKFEAQLHALQVDFTRLGVSSGSAQEAAGAVREIESSIEKLAGDFELKDLLSREGYAARIYWSVLAGTALPWPTWTHKRVPAHWLQIWPRDSGASYARAREATDPFNALLNYGYTLLEVETRIACHGEGLDPDMGLIHVDARLRESLILDLLEPLRSKVDGLSLEFCQRDGLRPHMFTELRSGVVRLHPETAREYAGWLMPQLRTPAVAICAEFAREVRQISIPYRLVDDRTAVKKPGTCLGIGGPCGYCKQPLKKTGLKFCSRHCYLRHSVEVDRPIEKARAKLAEMRANGLSPGHGGEAAKIRGAKIGESNRRRAMQLTPEEQRARRAEKSRKRREVAGAVDCEAIA